MVGGMFVRGNVLVGKCLVREVSGRGIAVRGNVRRGSVCRGFALGEVSVEEVSGRETVLQSSETVVRRSFKYFTKITGTHLCQNLFLIKLQISASLLRFCNFEYAIISQLTFTCSMPTKETLEKEVKYVYGKTKLICWSTGTADPISYFKQKLNIILQNFG